MLGLVAVATAVVLWGGSSVAIKAVSTSGVVTAFYRLWFAIPLLWLLVAIRPGMRRRLDRGWLGSCLAGGSLFALHQVLFFSAIKLTTVADVTIIGALQPALVLVAAAPLFGERTPARALGWTALGFAGTALVVAGARGAPTWSLSGDAVSFGNLFAFTAYFLASKRIRRSLGAWEYVVGMTTVAGLWMAAVALAMGEPLASPRGWEWAVLAGLAIFPGTLGHVLVNWAHEHVPALSVSTVLLAVPVLAALGAAVFLGEPIRPLQALGGAVVLGSILAVLRSTAPEAADELARSAAATDAP